MSGKGFSSPLFGKRRSSEAPSINSKRPANPDLAPPKDTLGSKLRSRSESNASRNSTAATAPPSPTPSTVSILPPLSIKPVEDITTLTIAKIKASTYLESKKLNTLHAAVHSGDLRKLKSLLAEKSRDVNKIDTYHGLSALHLAVDENKYDVACLLIEPVLVLSERESGNIKVREAFEKSPLKLIRIDALNREGRTPLMLAVIRGYSDIVHLLLKNHADVNVQDMIGCTALHYAIYLGDISSFKLLTDRGAKVDAIDKSGIPLFYHAIKCKREKMALVLIQGLSADALNTAYGSDASTALHLAVEKSLNTLVHTLIDIGVNPVALDAEKRKPVERIDYSEYNDTIQEIVDFLTLTEMSMFGSITSFADTMNNSGSGTVSKSVVDLISRSAASLASPKGSNGDLLTGGQRAFETVEESIEEDKYNDDKVLKEAIQKVQEQVETPTIAAGHETIQNQKQVEVGLKENLKVPDIHQADTSPLLTFTGDELSETEDDDIMEDISNLDEAADRAVESVVYSSDHIEVRLNVSHDQNNDDANSAMEEFSYDSDAPVSDIEAPRSTPHIILPDPLNSETAKPSVEIDIPRLEQTTQCIHPEESNQIKDLHSRIKELEFCYENQLKGSSVQIAELEERLNSQTPQLTRLIEEKEQNLSKIETLQNTLAVLAHKLQDSESEYSALRLDLQRANEEHKEQITSYEIKIVSLEENLKVSLFGVNAEKAIEKHTVTELYHSVESLQHKLHEKDLEISSLNSTIQLGQVHTKALQEKIDASVEKQQSLERQLEDSNFQNTEFVGQNETLKWQLHTLDTNLKELSKNNQNLEKEKNLILSEVETLERKALTNQSAVNESCSNLVTENEQLKQQLDAELQETKSLRLQIEGNRQVLESYTQRIAADNEHTNTQQKEISRLIDQINSLANDKLKLQNSLEEETKTTQVFESKLQEAEIQNTENVEELSAAKIELNNLDVKLKAAEIQISALKVDHSASQLQITTLKSQIDEKTQAIGSLQVNLKHEVEQREKFHRLSLKLETEFAALKTELAISKGIINNRDNQVDSFRETLKEMKAEQQAQAMTIRGNDLNTAVNMTQEQMNGDILKYYEAEIALLGQNLTKEYDLQAVQHSENTQLLASVSLLEENLAAIQSKYIQQSGALQLSNQLKLEAQDQVIQLESIASQTKIQNENMILRHSNEVGNLKSSINSLSKDLAETKLLLSITNKEKSELRKLWEESQSEFKLKVLHHQQELADLKRLSQQRLEKSIQECESKLEEAASKSVVQAQKIHGLEEEKLKLNHKCSQQGEEHENVVLNLENEIKSLQNSLAATKQSFNEEIVLIQTQVESLQTCLSKSEQTVAEKEEECQSLGSQIFAMQTNEAELEEEVASLKQKWIFACQEIAESTKKYEETLDNIRQDQVRALHREESLNHQLRELESHQEESKNEYHLLMHKNCILEKESNELTAKIQSLHLDISSIRMQAEIREPALLKSNENLSKSLDELQTLNESNNLHHQQELEDIQGFYQQSLEKTGQEFALKLQNAEDDNEGKVQKIQNLENEMLKLNHKLTQLLQEHETALLKCENQINSLRNEISKTETTLNEKEKELVQSKTIAESLQQKLSKSEQIVVELQTHATEIEEEVASLTKKLISTRQELGESNEELEKIMDFVGQNQSEAQRREESLNNQLKSLLARQEEFERENRLLMDKNGSLENEFKEVTSKIQSLLLDIHSLRMQSERKEFTFLESNEILRKSLDELHALYDSSNLQHEEKIVELSLLGQISLEKVIQEFDLKLKDAVDDNEGKAQKIQNLENEMLKLNHKLAQLLQEHETALLKYENQIKSLQNEISKAESALNDKEKDLVESKTIIEFLQQNLSKFEQSIAEKQEKTQSLDMQFDMQNREVELEEEVASQKEKLILTGKNFDESTEEYQQRLAQLQLENMDLIINDSQLKTYLEEVEANLASISQNRQQLINNSMNLENLLKQKNEELSNLEKLQLETLELAETRQIRILKMERELELSDQHNNFESIEVINLQSSHGSDKATNTSPEHISKDALKNTELMSYIDSLNEKLHDANIDLHPCCEGSESLALHDVFDLSSLKVKDQEKTLADADARFFSLQKEKEKPSNRMKMKQDYTVEVINDNPSAIVADKHLIQLGTIQAELTQEKIKLESLLSEKVSLELRNDDLVSVSRRQGNEICALEQQNATLKDEMNSLKANLEKTNTILASVSEEHIALLSETAKLKSDQTRSIETQMKIDDQIGKLEQTLSLLPMMLNAERWELNSTSSANADLTTELKLKQEKVSEYQSYIEEMEKGLTPFPPNQNTIENSTNSSTFEKTLKAQQADLNAMVAVLNDCKNSLGTERQQKSEIQVTYNHIQSELEERIKSHQSEVEDLQKLSCLRIESLTKENECKLQAVLGELNTYKKTTNERIHALQNDLSVSQTKLQEKTDVLEELQKIKHMQDAQMTDLLQQHESVQSLNQLLQAKLMEVERNVLSRLSESNNEKRRLEHENTQLLENIASLEQSISEMNDRIGGFGVEQAVRNESLAEAAMQVRTLENELVQQTQEVQVLSQKSMKLESLLDQSLAENNTLKTNWEKMELQVSEKLDSQNQIILDREHELTMSKMDLLKTESMLKETQTRLQTIEKNFKDSSISVEELRSSVATLTALNLSLQQKLETKQTQTAQDLKNDTLRQEKSIADSRASVQTQSSDSREAAKQLNIHCSNDMDQSRTIIEAMQLENRELLQKEFDLEKQLINVQVLKNSLLLKNNDFQKEVDGLKTALAREVSNQESLHNEIDKLKNMMSRELDQERNQSRALTAQLEAERKNTLKYNSIRGHLYSLSSIANLSNSDASKSNRVSETTASNAIESTETLTDESAHASRSKLSKHKMETTSSLETLNGLRSAFTHEAQTVVMRLSNLEDAIQSDTSKMATLLNQINSDSQIEREMKEVMKGVFGSQYERSLDTSQKLASAKKIVQNSLSSLGQEFKEIVNLLETANLKQTMDIRSLQSEKEKLLLLVEKKSHEMEKALEELQKDTDILQKELCEERRQKKQKSMLINNLQEEIQQFENDLEYERGNSRKAKSANLLLQTQLDENIQQLHSEQARQQQLQSELTQVRKRKLELEEQTSRLESEAKATDSLLKQLSRSHQQSEKQLREENEQLKLSILESKAEAKLLGNEMAEIKEKVDCELQSYQKYDIGEQLSLMLNEFVSLSTHLKSVAIPEKSNNKLLLIEQATMNKKINELESRISENKSSKTAFLDEVDPAKPKSVPLVDYEAENQKLCQKTNVLEAENYRLSLDLNNSLSQCAILKERLDTCVKMRNDLAVKAQSLEAGNEHLNSVLKSRNIHESQAILLLKQDVEELQNRLERSMQSNREEKLANLEDMIQELNVKLGDPSSQTRYERICESTHEKPEPYFVKRQKNRADNEDVASLKRKLVKVEAKITKISQIYNNNLMYICQSLKDHAVDRKLVRMVEFSKVQGRKNELKLEHLKKDLMAIVGAIQHA
ncbi:UNVERIFIED_CONTAM: hypothetical protein HDU68_003223 [Siphonaria sp. JEL0065]|nr:hypothetical protein HDU68_003223 [Siphonaria sp. JEL0065]